MSEFLICDEVKELLSPYFDGEVTYKEKNLIEKHLETCQNCRQKLENLKRTTSLVRKASVCNFSENLLPVEMQKCLRVKANLSAFIDGELDRKETIELLEHVINCEFCRSQYEKIKQTQDYTRSYLEKSLNNGVYPNKNKPHVIILEQIREQKKRTKILSSAAALAFIAVLSWFPTFQLEPTITPTEINIDKTRFIQTDKPMYVNAEDYVISELDTCPPEEVVSLIYGD